MTVLDSMRGLSSAEEFFALLDVPYDPTVLRVARLHIMRRMGEYLSGTDLAAADDDAARALCRSHLQHAYDDFVVSTPIEQRVFKALKDAVEPRPKGFVSFDTLTAAQEET